MLDKLSTLKLKGSTPLYVVNIILLCFFKNNVPATLLHFQQNQVVSRGWFSSAYTKTIILPLKRRKKIKKERKLIFNFWLLTNHQTSITLYATISFQTLMYVTPYQHMTQSMFLVNTFLTWLPGYGILLFYCFSLSLLVIPFQAPFLFPTHQIKLLSFYVSWSLVISSSLKD